MEDMWKTFSFFLLFEEYWRSNDGRKGRERGGYWQWEENVIRVQTIPCTRVVFGARAKLCSGFHFISGPPSTILLWSVMDFLPPSRYRLSLSPNVYYTQGVGGWLQGEGSRQGRYSTWDTFVHHSCPFLSCFFSVSSLLFIPFATSGPWPAGSPSSSIGEP